MRRAILIENSTGKTTRLKARTRIGRASDNELVLETEGTCPYHCLIWRSFFQRWYIRHIGEAVRGAGDYGCTIMKRETHVWCLLAGEASRLAEGDQIAFGREADKEEVAFTHSFQFM